MLVNYKNRKLLLPFDPMYYCWWVKKYNAKMKFYGIAVPAPDASRILPDTSAIFRAA